MDRDMEESRRQLTEWELKNKAYLAALQLNTSGLDEKVIYAGLENQIPDALARQIAKDVTEPKKEYPRQPRPIYKFYFD